MDSILITGADGFLGSNLCRELLHRYLIVALVKNCKELKRIRDIADRIKVIDDITVVYDLLEQQKIKFIIHSATNYGRDLNDVASMLQTNIVLPVSLLQKAMSKCEAFINIDTFFSKCDTEALYMHLSEYTLSKIQLKQWLQVWLDKIKIINLQLEHMYGPGDAMEKFVPSIITQLLENKEKIALTDGAQKRDFIYIDDVVRVVATVLDRISLFEKKFYNIETGTGQPVSIRQFVDTAKKITGSISELHYGVIQKTGNEFEESKADITKLQELGFSPAYTIEDGIQKIVHSLK